MMAMIGVVRPVMVIMMLKIWIPLPIIHIMKHMNPTCMNGSLDFCNKACA